MHRFWLEAALLLGLALAAADASSAQQLQPPAMPTQPRGKIAGPALQPDPNLDADDQLAPSQIRQPIPAAVATPTGGEKRTRATARTTAGTVEPDASARPRRAAKRYVIACSGVFARDSSHAKLVMAFRSRNVAFTQVDTASGGKVMASVLFAKDPKRRLEVWWSQPASRTETHLIVINGQSEWIAPGELRLGLTLADLERLNGKPFKLSGFDKNHVAALSDWNGGRLAALAGGCKVGLSLRAVPTTPAAALNAAPADRAFGSADEAMRTVDPTVSEILLAY